MVAAALVFAFVLLTGLYDLYTTKRAVTDHPELFHEKNPLMARFGQWGKAAIKLAAIAGIGFVLFKYPNEKSVLAASVGAGILWGLAAWANRRKLHRALGVALVLAIFTTSAIAEDAVAPSLPPGEIIVPFTIGYVKGLTFGLGVGYRFSSGVTMSLQAMAIEGQTINGTTTGTYDYDMEHRWPVVDVTLPYTVHKQTSYGLVFNVGIPTGKTIGKH